MQLTTELNELAVTSVNVIHTTMTLSLLQLITMLGHSIHMDFPYALKKAASYVTKYF